MALPHAAPGSCANLTCCPVEASPGTTLYVRANQSLPAPPSAPPPAVQDWHYPASEASEAAGLDTPVCTGISVAAGTATLSSRNGSSTVSEGDVFNGWLVLSVFTAVDERMVVALEYSFADWGVMVFLSTGTTIATLRTAIGTVSPHVERKGGKKRSPSLQTA